MQALLKSSELSENFEFIDEPELSISERLKKYYHDETLFDKLNDERELGLTGPTIEHFKEAIDSLVNRNAKVLIVSDYDCDGVTSLTIMVRLFARLGLKVNYYIPSRIKEGYGLSVRIVEMAHKNGFDTILTLDNGIVAFDALAKAKEYGMEVNIVDHHEYQNLPDVNAIVHPNLLDDYYEGLCTGGLTYLISKQYYEDDYSAILAMVATLADVCKVFKGNRMLLKNGLERLNDYEGQPLPIHYLLKKQKSYTFSDISFQLVPKINAISRMDHLTNINMFAKFMLDTEHANLDTVEQINKINDIRKQLSRDLAEQAASDVDPNQNIIVVYDDEFVEGLCGLIATNLVRRFDKPCLVLTKGENDIIKGSGRSIDGFDLYGNLTNLKDLFTSFGGHQKAVGLSLNAKDFDEFKERLSKIKVEVVKKKKPCLLVQYAELNNDNFGFLNQLEPYGEGFEEPLFCIVRPVIKSKFLIKNLYPKFTFDNGCEAISFDKSTYVDQAEAMIGHLSFNNFNHKVKLNLNLENVVI